MKARVLGFDDEYAQVVEVAEYAISVKSREPVVGIVTIDGDGEFFGWYFLDEVEIYDDAS